MTHLKVINETITQQYSLTPPPHPEMDEEDLCQIDQPRGGYTHWRQYQYARWRIIRFVNIFKNHLFKKKSICITLLPVINCHKHN